MDASIRKVSIAEHAKEAARAAVNTFEQQANPHPSGTPDHAAWHAAYCRWILTFSAEEDCEVSA